MASDDPVEHPPVEHPPVEHPPVEHPPVEHPPVEHPPVEHPPVEIPINGVLDLHTFSPREVKELLPEYLHECQTRGILQVRVVHGKGTGALRRQVHALLARLPEVAHFRLADESAGQWGATLVDLRAP
jgi:dsDNA-specific endonuclease/ATPase MutS2